MTDWSLLQEKIGVSFNDVSLLQQAFVHRSYLNENPEFEMGSNERLEFLGDALLGFIVADGLYRQFTDLNEGEMTKIRSAIVRQDSLARLASSLGLGEHLYLGQGEEKSGGRKRPRNLACLVEALIGAIFIDQGFEKTDNFILNLFTPTIEQVIKDGLADYKSKLQEKVQARGQGRPIYHLVEASGPDHDRRFTVNVLIGGEVLGQGIGKSKQLAEKEAARQALKNIPRNSDQTT